MNPTQIEEMFGNLSRRIRILELALVNETPQDRIMSLEQRVTNLEMKTDPDEQVDYLFR